MLTSISNSTMKQYEVTYRLWWNYCSKNNIIDFFNPPVESVITFLVEIFQNGASYGSINSHRSALSLLLIYKIGSNECIKRILKGMYKQRPTRPKYTNIWDPQIVLNHVSSWYPNRTLSLEKLTKKVSILLALCTAHRVQTLSLLKVSNISRSQSGLKILVSDVVKTSAAGREQPVLLLPYYLDNVQICPATTIDDYLINTADLRTDGMDNLLLTFRKPNRKATSQTISRWIRQVLSESGIDLGVFGAHSTRHASTSAAASAGIDINTIRRTAGWTSTSSTFMRFYNRPLQDEGSFARAACAMASANDAPNCD